MVLVWLPLLLCSFWIVSKVHKYRKVLHGLQYKPGLRFFFRLQSASPLMVIPSIPYISLGYEWPCRLKHKVLSSRGKEDVINFITCFPSIQPGFLIADPLSIKEIFSDRNRFPKYQEIYHAMKVFGRNILITEGDEWKRHRKAVAPSFSEKNNKIVWEEAIKTMLGLIEKWGKDEEVVTIEHMPDITVQVALRVLALRIISAAGFGRSITWDEGNNKVSRGHRFSFQRALNTFLKRLPLKVITPEWMSLIFPIVRETHESFRDLQLYMEEMISERRQMKSFEYAAPRHDLLNAILASNEEGCDEKSDNRFTKEEVIANMFIFLLAGHETVAHSLSFTLGLLAIHQNEQEKLFKHIVEILGGKEVPAYDQINSFSYVLATFYEVMRLFPPVPVISKQAAEDTTIPMQRSKGMIEHIPVPKNSCLLIDVAALHYNPKYWKDPEIFDPSRFMGDWNKDAHIPFSGGMRGCIGRRFAEVEAIALLVIIIKHYKVELKDPEQYAGLDAMEKRTKLLRSRTGVTLTPLHVPLVFRQRGVGSF